MITECIFVCTEDNGSVAVPFQQPLYSSLNFQTLIFTGNNGHDGCKRDMHNSI